MSQKNEEKIPAKGDTVRKLRVRVRVPGEGDGPPLEYLTDGHTSRGASRVHAKIDRDGGTVTGGRIETWTLSAVDDYTTEADYQRACAAASDLGKLEAKRRELARVQAEIDELQGRLFVKADDELAEEAAKALNLSA